MIKNLSQLTHKVGEREYHLLCSMDSPVNEAKEAVFEFLKYIGKIEDAAKMQVEHLAKEAEEKLKVEKPEVVIQQEEVKE